MKIGTLASFSAKTPDNPVELSSDQQEIRSSPSRWGQSVARFFRSIGAYLGVCNSEADRQRQALNAFRQALTAEYGPRVAQSATQGMEGRLLTGRDIQRTLNELTEVVPEVRKAGREHNQVLIEHHAPKEWLDTTDLTTANLRDPRNLYRSLVEDRVEALSAHGMRRLTSADVGPVVDRVASRLQRLKTPEDYENAHRAFNHCATKMRQLLSCYASGGMDSAIPNQMRDLEALWREVSQAFKSENPDRTQMNSDESVHLGEALLGRAMSQLDEAQQLKVYTRLQAEGQGTAFTLEHAKLTPSLGFMGDRLKLFRPGGKWDDPQSDALAKKDVNAINHENGITMALSGIQPMPAGGAAGGALLETLTRGTVQMRSDLDRSKLSNHDIKSIATTCTEAMAGIRSEDEAKVARQTLNWLTSAYQKMLTQPDEKKNQEELTQALMHTMKAFKIKDEDFALLDRLKWAAFGLALQTEAQLSKASSLALLNKGAALVLFNRIDYLH